MTRRLRLLAMAVLIAVPAAAYPSQADALAAPASEPITALTRFSTEDLSRQIHPAVARSFSGFWRWYDAFFKPGLEALTLD